MKANYTILVFVALVVLSMTMSSTAFSQTISWSGVWNTNFNKMMIDQRGDRVSGTYEHSNGRIEGVVSGNKLTGTWIQSNGKGKFVFSLSSDGKSFTGKWGYDNDTPASAWTGTRTTPVSYLDTPPVEMPFSWEGGWNSDFKKMTLTQKAGSVTGSYEHSGGKIEGAARGNALTGIWTQTNGKGKFEFIMSSDGKTFIGKWGRGNDIPSAKWNGTRTTPIAYEDQPIVEGVYWSGQWDTDFKRMKLVQMGSGAKGTYEHQNGKIEGTINGNIFFGVWIQDNAKGRFEFTMSPDGKSFVGKWGYNDDTPASQWNGARVK
jgi:hypothetical protein